MDIKQRQELIKKFNEQKQSYEEAKGMSDEARAALAAAELAKLAHELSHSPIPLSADPSEIVKAIDKLRTENRLKALGVENDPEVRRMLGLPPLEAPWAAPFGGAEGTKPSPIILDLDGDGVETTALDAGAYFDHDSNGFAEQTGWVGKDDGLLVWDRDGDGRINDGKELFGDQTLLADGTRAANGFQALAELDDNHDGKVDANDAAFANLKVWKDADGDGYTSAGELFVLADVGVQAINTGYADSAAVDANGNAHKQVGSFARSDGSMGVATDVWFKANTTLSIAEEWLDVPTDIAALANVQGYGNVYDLHQAMVRDTSGALSALVQAFVAESAAAGRSLLLEQILYKWTGSENIDPASRGGSIDARKLAVLEKFMGRGYAGWTGPDPVYNAAPILERAYHNLQESVYAQLMAQTHLAGLFGAVTYAWDAEMQQLRPDIEPMMQVIEANLAADRVATLDKVGELLRTFIGFGFFKGQIESDQILARLESMGADVKEVVQYTILSWAASKPVYGSGQNDILEGNIGNDYLAGNGGNDALSGYWGDDQLVGGDGEDVLHGGSGNDYLDGGEGNDTLDGGTGNDALDGGAGDDAYVFGRGYGQDTITDFDYANGGGQDTIRLAADINPTDVTLSRDTSSLYLSINGTSDSLTISNWYGGTNYRVERMEFADGTVWDAMLLANAPYLGSDGSDYLSGANGNETFIGGSGDDTLYGNGGGDVLDGGTGDDALVGGAGDDTYVFGRGYGQDTIYDIDYANGGGQDTIRLAADINPADVTLSRDASSLYLSINGTSDRLTVSNWYGGANYRVERMEFADGTVWDATLLANAPYIDSGLPGSIPQIPQGEIIVGQNSDDTLYGNGGNDVLDGGLGYDTLQGGAGDDVYLFGRGYGRDTITDFDSANGGGQDTIRLAADINPADVTLSRDASSLYLSISGTSDRLTVSNWYSGTNYRVERMEFADGTVWDVTLLADAPYLGTDGTDYLPGTNDNETFIGGGGDDMLYGNGGNDVLDGGLGYDTLQGGAGDDVYLFGRGNGQDTIYDFDYANGGGQDTIRLAADINPADVTLSRDASSLYLSINGTSDRLTVSNWYGGTNYRVERMEFADGTVWDAALLEDAPRLGTDGSITLYGSDDSETLIGLGGNDMLYGNGGNDILSGGTGNDSIDGGSGDDTYLFGRGYGRDTISEYDTTAGNSDTILLKPDVAPEDVTLWRDASSLYLGINGTSDRIMVQSWFADTAYRVEQIEFADGTVWNAATLAAAKFVGTDAADYLYGTAGTDVMEGLGGDDYLTGGEGDDTLDGGTGNDALDGGTGNDTYVFGRGYGQDTLSDYDPTAGNIDTIRLAAGISASDVTLSRDASNLYLGINGSSDRITVQSRFADPVYRVERIEFADGTVWDTSLMQAAKFSGTDAADYIAGTTGNEVIEGLGGDDSLTGGEGDDTLDGGTGNDALDGGTGNDTYVFGRGYGQDTLSDYDAMAGNIDTIRLAAGISASDVTLSRDASSLYLGINGTSDKITVQSWFADPVYRVEQIEFADGTVWNAATLAAAKFVGTDAADYLYGTAGADVMEGLGGDDYLTGGEGDDTLDGGIGNDTLDGGTGNDTYLFGRGYGQDTLSDYDPTAGNIDTIRLAAGISASDVTLSRDASNLYLGINGSSDRITVQNWFDDPAYRVEQVQFDDGTIWDAAKLQQTAVFLGTAGADALYGTAQDEIFDGLGGDDYLAGSTGNDSYLFGHGSGQDTISDYDATAGNIDTIRLAAGISASDVTLSRDASNLYLDINGTSDRITVQSWFDDPAYRVEQVQFADGTIWDAAKLLQSAVFLGTAGADALYGTAQDEIFDGLGGDDYLAGSTGNDSYLFGHGSGQDTISDYDATAGNIDTIRLAAGISASDVTLSRDASNLYLGINGTSDRITVQSWFDDPAYRVEQVQFDDGTVWDAVLLQAAKFLGTEAADYLVGVAGNNNTVEGLGGDDTILGDMGNDILDGGAGNDSLTDAAGNDLLMGKAGDDALTGDAGNGLYIGGSGNDTITVGSGSNIIAFNRGDGQDVVNIGTGNDALSLGSGISYTDLAFRKTANDLILDTGASESITLKDWFAAPASHGVVTLQVIAESMPGFDPQSVDTLLSQKVQEFDFSGLASRFDAAQAADPAMTSWNLMNGLLDAHLASSDASALGGDLAYQYGLNGSLAGIGLAAAQDVLAAPQFGSQAQTLRPWSSLNSGTIQLS